MGCRNSKASGSCFPCAPHKRESTQQKCARLNEEVQLLHEELALASTKIETLTKEKIELPRKQRVRLDKVKEALHSERLTHVRIHKESFTRKKAEIHKKLDHLLQVHQATMRQAEDCDSEELENMKAAYDLTVKALVSGKGNNLNHQNNISLVEMAARLEEIQGEHLAKEAVRSIVKEEVAKHSAELQKKVDYLKATHQASIREAEIQHHEELQKVKAEYSLLLNGDAKRKKLEEEYEASLADVEAWIASLSKLSQREANTTAIEAARITSNEQDPTMRKRGQNRDLREPL